MTDKQPTQEQIKEFWKKLGAERYFNSDGSPQLRAIFCPIIFTDEWQAKLKEWRVE